MGVRFTTPIPSRMILQLSDGALIFGTSSYLYCLPPGSTSAIRIANLSGTNYITRDASDNLYFFTITLPASSYQVNMHAFVKGSGYYWVEGSVVTSVTPGTNGSFATQLGFTWCNTGGGTNSAGHLLIASTGVESGTSTIDSWYMILDAGVALAGTGTLLVNSAKNPTFIGTPVVTSGTPTGGMSADGFGGTSGLFVSYRNTDIWSIGSWAVSAAGALSTNTNITSTYASPLGPLFCIRTASNVFAIASAMNGASTKVGISRYSKTALLTAQATYGAVTDFVPEVWSATYDPTGAKFWVYGHGGVAADSLVRLGCTVSSGVTWDSTIVLDTEEANAAPGVGDILNTITAVPAPITAKGTDVMVGGDLTAAKVGCFTAWDLTPEAPALTGPTNASYVDLSAASRFAWSNRFPSSTDTLAAFGFRKKNAAAAKTITTVAVTSNVATITTSTAHGLQVGDVITNTGLTHTALNVTAVVVAIPTTATFTFAVVTANVASVADAGTETPNYGYWNGTNFSATATVWNLSSSAEVLIPASVFGVNGTSYVWSIATKENTSGLTGAYATDFSLLSHPSPTVTVTAPSGAITTTTQPTVTWTYAQAENLVQSSYRVLVYDTTVVGAPNPGVDGLQAWDSGTVQSSAVSATVSSPLINGHNFSAYVLVTASSGSSAWTVSTFNLNATVPTTPTLSASYSATTAATTLTGTGTAAGGYTFANTTMLFQYSDDGTTWYTVRGGSAVAPNASFIGTVIDYEAQPGIQRSYRVYVVGTGSIQSLTSTTQNSTAVPTSWWIKDPLAPATNVAIRVTTEGQLTRRINRGVFDVLGSTYPLVVKDARHAVELPLEVQTTTKAERDALVVLLATEHTLLVQAPSTVGVSRYVEVGASVEERVTVNVPYRFSWTLPCVEVAAP